MTLPVIESRIAESLGELRNVNIPPSQATFLSKGGMFVFHPWWKSYFSTLFNMIIIIFSYGHIGLISQPKVL